MSQAEIVIAGGGITGLWCAVKAAEAGLRTTLLERAHIGAGASGGLLGALMPHQPAPFNPLKAFQRDALISLETEIAALEAATGVDCGYRRCGRLVPIRTPGKSAQERRMSDAASAHWPDRSPQGQALGWSVLPTVPDPSWLRLDAAPLGCAFETLSARVAPRAYLAALGARARQLGVEVREGVQAVDVSCQSAAARLELADGTKLSPGAVILAAGVETFALATPLAGCALGGGVKGQAALLEPLKPVDPASPILYDGGVYVVAHGPDRIAVGSTSEDVFEDPRSTDAALDAVIAKAMVLCPALDGARTIERWAGVRPKAIGRQALVGPLPEAPRVILATGGFKISFGIAHRMAAAAIAAVTGAPDAGPELPAELKPRHHLEAAAAALAAPGR